MQNSRFQIRITTWQQVLRSSEKEGTQRILPRDGQDLNKLHLITVRLERGHHLAEDGRKKGWIVLGLLQSSEHTGHCGRPDRKSISNHLVGFALFAGVNLKNLYGDWETRWKKRYQEKKNTHWNSKLLTIWSYVHILMSKCLTCQIPQYKQMSNSS